MTLKIFMVTITWIAILALLAVVIAGTATIVHLSVKYAFGL